jgi:hypothetical protein
MVKAAQQVADPAVAVLGVLHMRRQLVRQMGQPVDQRIAERRHQAREDKCRPHSHDGHGERRARAERQRAGRRRRMSGSRLPEGTPRWRGPPMRRRAAEFEAITAHQDALAIYQETGDHYRQGYLSLTIWGRG